MTQMTSQAASARQYGSYIGKKMFARFRKVGLVFLLVMFMYTDSEAKFREWSGPNNISPGRPDPRWQAGCSVLDGLLYVFGGDKGLGNAKGTHITSLPVD